MHPRERLADLAAMTNGRPANPKSVEKGDDRRRAAGEFAERFAGSVADRLRAGDAAPGQMLHQPDEERQIGRPDPFFVEREDELARGGAQEKIGILDPLGDSLERDDVADVVEREEVPQRLVRDFRVDGHCPMISRRGTGAVGLAAGAGCVNRATFPFPREAISSRLGSCQLAGKRSISGENIKFNVRVSIFEPGLASSDLRQGLLLTAEDVGPPIELSSDGKLCFV